MYEAGAVGCGAQRSNHAGALPPSRARVTITIMNRGNAGHSEPAANSPPGEFISGPPGADAIVWRRRAPRPLPKDYVNNASQTKAPDLLCRKGSMRHALIVLSAHRG
jgi:hypothetical protein